MSKIKVKILTEKYMPELNLLGPVLTPMFLDEELVESLKSKYRFQIIETKTNTEKSEGKLLFTGTPVSESEKETSERKKEDVEPVEITTKRTDDQYYDQ